MKKFTDNLKPDLVFLSEPLLFQTDLQSNMEYFRGDFAFLNSEDLYDKDLPMAISRAEGGTLMMWKSSLDPFITVLDSDSPAFLPVILELPDTVKSIHVGLYLTTAGREEDYLRELANLTILLDELAL